MDQSYNKGVDAWRCFRIRFNIKSLISSLQVLLGNLIKDKGVFAFKIVQIPLGIACSSTVP